MRRRETSRQRVALTNSICEALLAAAIVSMITNLVRAGERCRSTLHAARTLARVLFVALRGLYRSRRARAPTAQPGFLTARQSAYRQLWAKLDNLYWKLRDPNCDVSIMRALLHDVDAILTENLFYIGESDQGLFSQYILSLQCLGAATHPVKRSDTAAAWGDVCGRTAGRVPDVDRVIQQAVDLRNQVLRQLRRELSST